MFREQVKLFSGNICSRYKCSKHNKLLIDAVLVNSRGRVTEFFICPVRGCKYSKPNKWQWR